MYFMEEITSICKTVKGFENHVVCLFPDYVCEGVDLSGIEDGGITDLQDRALMPGEKVDRFRFMTFYLESDTNHFNDTNGIFEVKKPSDAKEEDGQ